MIPQRLIEVMKQITSLGKDGQNQHQHYAYLSEERIVTELHGAFVKAGLTIRPMAMEVLSDTNHTVQSGAVWNRIRLAVTYEIADPDGDKALVQTIGEGLDNGDKATNKAMTAAFKYALRQTCMISTGDDPDKESPTVPAKAPQAPRPNNEVAKEAAKQGGAPPQAAVPGTGAPLCEICGVALKGYTTNAGKAYTADQMAEYSRRDCEGHIYCYDHKKAYKEGALQSGSLEDEPLPTEE